MLGIERSTIYGSLVSVSSFSVRSLVVGFCDEKYQEESWDKHFILHRARDATFVHYVITHNN